MTHVASLSDKLALTGQATSTLGTDANWDRGIRNFLRRYALWNADSEFGSKAKAYDASGREALYLECKFGKGWKHHPQAQADVRRRFEAVSKAEDESSERYLLPYWESIRDLALIPAPTIEAASFKQLLIEAEELWNDPAMKADCMQIVIDDFERLAG